MAKRGRPPKGPSLVDGLDGSDAAKERFKIILRTLSGELSVEEACALLGVGEARFYELRTLVLQTALNDLEPRKTGRKPAPPPTAEEERLQQLKAENEELKIELRAAQIREELWATMPHVMKPRADGSGDFKKKP